MSLKQRNNSRRLAFTLLEMLLAMSIGMLLMVGLYFALDMHLSGAQAGRAQVDQAQVARNVLKRLTADVKEQLAMLDVYPTPTSTSKKTTTTTVVAGTVTTVAQFNMGVVGESDWMALYISKVPKSAQQSLSSDGLARAEDKADDSDLRRIVYWLVPNSDGQGGLARQEVKIVTSEDEIAAMPPGIPDEQAMVFATSIVAISFEYFDGTSWQSSWDGTTVAEEGQPPVGPPVAIRINLSVAPNDHTGAAPDDPTVRVFQHIIQIPTANFYNAQTTTMGGGKP